MDVKETLYQKNRTGLVSDNKGFNRLSENLLQAAKYISSEVRKANNKGAMIALFKGAASSEKGLVARQLAQLLGKDIYRVDMSQMVSKYIGETEKNLSRVLLNASNAGVILFFDEADALFGKRTGVVEEHERYANQETSFLLERLESYNGLVIISSQSESGLDPQLIRHIQFVINFDKTD